MPQRKRRSRNRATLEPTTPPAEVRRLSGLWHDGKWLCNCDPRREAVLREVKKQGHNKGKFFWKCQLAPYCDFFLWYDDALLRQDGIPSTAVPDAGPSTQRPKTPSSTQRQITAYAIQKQKPGADLSPPKSNRKSGPSADHVEADELEVEEMVDRSMAAMESPSASAAKRKRDTTRGRSRDEQEAEDYGDFSSDDEKQLVALADYGSNHTPTTINTSRSALVTPPTNRSFSAASDFSATSSIARNLFPRQAAGRKEKSVSFEDPETSLTTPATTPYTARNMASTPGSKPDEGGEDVVTKVMEILEGENISKSVSESVHSILSRLARQKEGLTRTLDIVRNQSTKKDDRIAKLQAKVAELRTETTYQHKQITNMKGEMMRIYQEN